MENKIHTGGGPRLALTVLPLPIHTRRRTMRGMAFAHAFDGFAVIHARFLHPERESHFRLALAAVGVRSPAIIETRPVPDSDPRLCSYKGRANGLISLIDGFIAAVDLAESRGWESVCICENDIAFRGDFHKRWRQAEPQIHSTNWGVLTLHRTMESGQILAPEPMFGTHLIPVQHNQLTHCVIVRRPFYARFRESMLTCIERGYPSDFFYGIFSWYHPEALYATDRNITGQAPMASSLQAGPSRKSSRYSMFRSASALECALVNPIHRLIGG